MPQFDVLRLRSSAISPFVVDVQADVHSKLTTRIVIPMIPRTRYTQPATRLTPVTRFRDDDYVLVVPFIASVAKSSLGEVVGSLATERATLIAALDLLITGS